VATIRDARPGEHEALVALQWRSSLVWESDRDALLSHPDAIEIPVEAITEGRLRVACEDDVLVGFSLVLAPVDGVVELDGLFVDPDAMRRGIGLSLVGDVARRARDAGARRIEVTGNPNALPFYENIGFVVTGDATTRFGAGLRLRLDL